MLKKLLSITVILSILCTFLSFNFGFTASAETEGIFSFVIKDNEAMLTNCKSDVKGTVTIPEELGGYPVTSIGGEAFSSCLSLKKIIIPNTVVVVDSKAFEYCKNLKTITIPGSIKGIKEDTFYNCISLEEIIIENGVEYIDRAAFNQCPNLKKLTIPPSIKVIGTNSIYDKYSGGTPFKGLNGDIEKVYISDLAAWCGIEFYGTASNPLSFSADLYLNGKLVTDMVIPNGVTSISNCAFNKYKKLKTVKIPDSVITIYGMAFNGCKNLTKVEMSKNLEKIGTKAFWNCKSLKEIKLYNKLKRIGSYAFVGNAISSIVIPDSVTLIGLNAFYNCDSLRKVVLSSGLTELSYNAFESCDNLKSVVIYDGLKTICDAAFKDCNNLSSVFYSADETKWDRIDIRDKNECLKFAKVYYNTTECPDHKYTDKKSYSCVICGETITKTCLREFDGKLYYYANGKLNTSYKGTFTFEGKTYEIKNGNATIKSNTAVNSTVTDNVESSDNSLSDKENVSSENLNSQEIENYIDQTESEKDTTNTIGAIEEKENQNTDNNEKDSSLWIWIIVSVFAVLIIGAAILFLLYKKGIIFSKK